MYSSMELAVDLFVIAVHLPVGCVRYVRGACHELPLDYFPQQVTRDRFASGEPYVEAADRSSESRSLRPWSSW